MRKAVDRRPGDVLSVVLIVVDLVGRPEPLDRGERRPEHNDHQGRCEQQLYKGEPAFVPGVGSHGFTGPVGADSAKLFPTAET